MKAKGFQVSRDFAVPNPNDRAICGADDGSSVSYVGTGTTKGMYLSFGWVQSLSNGRAANRRQRRVEDTTKIVLSFEDHAPPRRFKLNIANFLSGPLQRLQGMPTAVTANFVQVFKAIDEKIQADATNEQHAADQVNQREATRLQIEKALGIPCAVQSVHKTRPRSYHGHKPRRYTDYVYTVADGKLTITKADDDDKYRVQVNSSDNVTEPMTSDQVSALAALLQGLSSRNC